MTTTPTKGFGFTFWYSTDNITYTQIGSVVKMVEAEAKRDSIDLTVAADNYGRFAAGQVSDPGSASFDVAFDITDTGITQTLAYAFDSGITAYWKIELPPFSGPTPAGTIIFQGHLESFGLTVDKAEMITAKLSIKKTLGTGLPVPS